MKKSKKRLTPKPLPYPNAVPPRERLEQIVDLLLAFAICVGLTVSLMFLLTI